MPFDNLAEALSWLDGHIDFESSTPSRRSLPTLERMRQLAGLLGDPQRSYPSVHVTGTNGKGSTTTMAASLLGSMGLTVGAYTSPNLTRVNERLARAGAPIGDQELTELLGSLALLESLLDDRPTRFELLTAAAYSWFATEAVDAAVVEVGLGGTWDATNVVDAGVAVVTNISYDHTEVLGPTLEGIATDKSGIAKPGSTVVVGETDPGLVAVIRQAATAAGAARVWVRGEDFDCVDNRMAIGGRLVDLHTPGGTFPEVFVPLHGAHQGANAACALAAAEAFFGRPLPPTVVLEGFAAARIAGRLEVLGRHPLCLVDGAHNVAGMGALALALRDEFSVAGRRVAVVGMLTGRDPLAMLAPLAEAGVATMIACAPRSPRAMAPEVVAEAGRALGLEVTVVPDVADAVAAGRALVADDGLLVAAGSLYVVAQARGALAVEPATSPPTGGN